MRKVLEFLKYRLWAAGQFPSPDLVARHGGTLALVNYLKQCGSPDITKRILSDHGADIHPEAEPIGPWITVHEARDDFSNLTVGAHAHLGKEVFLDLTDRIVIERSAAVGMRCIILTHLNLGEGYPDKPTARLIPKRQAPTILRRGCSVGAGSVLLCGVEIGEDAVINAGVVVDQDVPARTIVTSSRQRNPYTMPQKFFAKFSSR
jgi:acetyltransferase-like isoleucine patch superfamily enzyme